MARKRRQIPDDLLVVRVAGSDRRGRGWAVAGDRRVFLPCALPGELVEFRYARRARRADEGRVERILEAAPERVSPRCPNFAHCGGCRDQHIAHSVQLQRATAALQDALAAGGVRVGRLEAPLRGPLWRYRRRARLAVRHVPKKGAVLAGFREKAANLVADMWRCEVMAPPVAENLVALRLLLGELEARQRIPQVEVACGDDEGAMVFRYLERLGSGDRARLAAFEAESGIGVFLQPGGLETVHRLVERPAGRAARHPREGSEQGGRLCYRLPAQGTALWFEPTDFIQVNGYVNRHLVDLAMSWLEARSGQRVLDLFCGIGNFTLPIAQTGAATLGVEGDARLVGRARENAARNGLSGVRFEVQDLFGEPGAGAALQWRPAKILLDPPRSGASELCRALVEGPSVSVERIVYVSCSLASFAADAAALVRGGYRLEKLRVVDMFPHTGHIETAACFEPR